MFVLYFPYFYFFGFFNRDFKPKGDIVRDVCGADGKYMERYQCVVLKDRSGDCLCADICKDTAGCVLANIGAETVSTAVFEDDTLVSLHVFPIGSTDITNDIALGLKISIEEAEEIKIGKIEHKHSQRRIRDIIEARLGDIFDLIQTHLKKLGRNELLPAGIIIGGGGSDTPYIEETAKATLRLPARIATLHTFNDSVSQTPLSGAWSVAYGLCIFGFDASYASDLSKSNRVRFQKHLHGLREWLQQFLP